MTDIASRILGAMNSLGRTGGVRARSIYLGRQESDEFEKTITRMAMIASKPDGNAQSVSRRSFNGAEVFVVDAPSHLGVGT